MPAICRHKICECYKLGSSDVSEVQCSEVVCIFTSVDSTTHYVEEQDKILRVDVVRNVIKGECDVTAWCGYSHLWTPPYDSLVIEMKMPTDNSLTNACFCADVLKVSLMRQCGMDICLS